MKLKGLCQMTINRVPYKKKQQKNNNDGNIYYLDEDWAAILSMYCIVGNCLPLETMLQKRCGRQQEMFLITHNLIFF